MGMFRSPQNKNFDCGAREREKSHLAHPPRRKNLAQCSNAPVHGAIMVQLPLTQTSADSPAACYLLAPVNIALLARVPGTMAVRLFKRVGYSLKILPYNSMGSTAQAL
ncbi:hypothetical protein HCH54_000506 [Aspergillus fumigatus]